LVVGRMGVEPVRGIRRRRQICSRRHVPDRRAPVNGGGAMVDCYEGTPPPSTVTAAIARVLILVGSGCVARTWTRR
jgi:hypothetical protein